MTIRNLSMCICVQFAIQRGRIKLLALLAYDKSLIKFSEVFSKTFDVTTLRIVSPT